EAAAVGGHDAARNRQSEADAQPLAGDEGLEDRFDLLRSDARPAVDDRDRDLPLAAERNPDQKHSRGGFRIRHGFAGIENEVEQHPLPLDGIAMDGRQVLRQLQTELYVATGEVAPQHPEDAANQRRSIERLALRPAALEERTQAPDD